MSGPDGAASTPIQCAVCGVDLAVLGLAARNTHVEACLDAPASASASTSASACAAVRFAATLERLDDCPVCGAAWTGPRKAHAKACAAQHGLTAKELSSLVDMFRESLDSTHGSSTSPGCGGPARPEPDPAASRAERRVPKKHTGKVLSFVVAEDDAFQSTRVRVPLRQAAISVRRISKKRQEVLDELDDDLCEAKALSLSLTRGSAQHCRKSKERPRGAAEQLERSDILASGEAQSYIRQRSVALELMDKENAASASAAPSRGSSGARTEQHAALWTLGSQESGPRDMYCPMFDAYK
ncbi:hypothetical protein IWQ57_002758 [Coemansia nantahalensis]|uniref:Uncharacterized protein n=1 Tax=Coemansia nantahalensis TaxID=2789366 RepID=A0ACC1JZB0_9FUNG|nr:hypothetical protein IWQ57_002758 [Coemansia nantahalensis]